MRSRAVALVVKQAIKLRSEAAGGLDDASPSRRAHPPSMGRTQGSRRRRGGSKPRAAIALVGVGGRIEDLACERVHAAPLTPGASGQASVQILGYSEEKLLHSRDAITILA